MIDDPVWASVTEVLRDPAIIAREVAKHRREGGLDQGLRSLAERLTRIANKQTRLAQAIAEVDDAAVAAPLYAELKRLAGDKQQAEREQHELQQRIADAKADEAKLQTLTDWCARVGTNLEELTYDEKRLALEALGVQVRVWRKGAVDDQGQPMRRWIMSFNPFGDELSFVYG